MFALPVLHVLVSGGTELGAVLAGVRGVAALNCVLKDASSIYPTSQIQSHTIGT